MTVPNALYSVFAYSAQPIPTILEWTVTKIGREWIYFRRKDWHPLIKDNRARYFVDGMNDGGPVSDENDASTLYYQSLFAAEHAAALSMADLLKERQQQNEQNVAEAKAWLAERPHINLTLDAPQPEPNSEQPADTPLQLDVTVIKSVSRLIAEHGLEAVGKAVEAYPKLYEAFHC
jgi:hypothetical protein